LTQIIHLGVLTDAAVKAVRRAVGKVVVVPDAEL